MKLATRNSKLRQESSHISILARHAALAALLGFAGMAAAQTPYPAKPIRFVVPFPAGGTPPEVVAKLNVQTVRILHTPEMKERLAAPGAEAVGNRPDGFAAFIKAEIPKYAKVIKASGAKAD